MDSLVFPPSRCVPDIIHVSEGLDTPVQELKPGLNYYVFREASDSTDLKLLSGSIHDFLCSYYSSILVSDILKTHTFEETGKELQSVSEYDMDHIANLGFSLIYKHRNAVIVGQDDVVYKGYELSVSTTVELFSSLSSLLYTITELQSVTQQYIRLCHGLLRVHYLVDYYWGTPWYDLKIETVDDAVIRLTLSSLWDNSPTLSISVTCEKTQLIMDVNSELKRVIQELMPSLYTEQHSVYQIFKKTFPGLFNES